MAYTFTDPRIGMTPAVNQVVSAASVGAVSLATSFRPGYRISGQDPTFGMGQFIFLPTIASVVVGSLVRFIESASGVFTTSMVPNTGNLGQPVAVAMAAGAANNYGWFMVQGTAPIKKTAVKVSPNVALFISATTGRVMSTVACGKQVLGIRASNSATVASATSTVTVTINNPHMQGQIT